MTVVSIHALLAECDRRGNLVPSPICRFNPRTPCGVRRPIAVPIVTFAAFQSTHSLRSATVYGGNVRSLSEFQSTHSLRSATGAGRRMVRTYDVSIHALLAECDLTVGRTSRGEISFQSTHSLRSATGAIRPQNTKRKVSIHALLAECDRFSSTATTSHPLFQSTHSLRSATKIS